jgi:hypothetical protein
MNNQVSKEESVESVVLHSTGDNKPPIENEMRYSGNSIIAGLKRAVTEYIKSLINPDVQKYAIEIISSIKIPVITGDFKKALIPMITSAEYHKILKDIYERSIGAVEPSQKLGEVEYDAVNHPSHYTTNTPIIRIKCECGKVVEVPIECIDVIRNMPSWKGNAIKYLWREGLKEDAELDIKQKTIQDLEKATWYIKDRIKELKKTL